MRGVPGSRRTIIPCTGVASIREDYAAGLHTQKELAGLWDTTPANIHFITSGKSRKDCGGPITHVKQGSKVYVQPQGPQEHHRP